MPSTLMPALPTAQLDHDVAIHRFLRNDQLSYVPTFRSFYWMDLDHHLHQEAESPLTVQPNYNGRYTVWHNVAICSGVFSLVQQTLFDSRGTNVLPKPSSFHCLLLAFLPRAFARSSSNASASPVTGSPLSSPRPASTCRV